MKTRFLLPNRYKRIGWILLGPCLAIGIMVMHFEFMIEGFEVSVPYGTSTLGGKLMANNLTDELAAVLMLVSLIMIAFSEEKTEDEWVAVIRLESLQWAVYVNYIFLFLAILLIYDMYFFEALVYNMFTILIIFIARFNYVLRVSFNPNRIERHEK